MLPGQARALLDKIIEEIEPGETAPGPAFATPRLRPYLPNLGHIGGLCRACWQGSGVLVRLIITGVRRGVSTAWKAARQGEKRADQWESVGVAVLVGVIALPVTTGIGGAIAYLAAPYAQQALIAGGSAWLLTAVILAPRAAWTKTEPGDPEQGFDVPDLTEPEPAPATLDAATVAALVRQIAGAGGWQGAHLDDVLAHLPGRSKAELLDTLADAGIPVAEQLKLRLPGGRQRNRQGVRLSTLPEGLGQAPPAPATTPAQPRPEHPAEAPPQPLPERPRVTVHGGG